MGRVYRQRLVFARATAGLLAAALFAGPLLESAHEASVRHVACPEDGELVDAPAQPRHAHAPQTNDGPDLFPEREQPATGGAVHEHCAIALRGHLRARPADAARLAPPDDVVALAAAPVAPPVRASAALYLLAPKAGPPQA